MSDLHDEDWHEREYNPRLTVAETADLLAAWPVRSAETYARHAALRDLVTGDHPRERADLFRAPDARGCVVFIHGGYFRSFARTDNAFVTEGFLGQGLSVAHLDYPLCPEVSVETLIASVKRSFARLVTEHLTAAERAALVVSGHSAGGYLTAALVATDWPAYGLAVPPFVGAVPVSGVFDLAPLVRTSMNREIQLTAERAGALDLTRASQQRVPVPVVAAVGGAESAEFRRQSAALADAWDAPRPAVLEVEGANHFTVLDALATPGSALNRAVVEMVG